MALPAGLSKPVLGPIAPFKGSGVEKTSKANYALNDRHGILAVKRSSACFCSIEPVDIWLGYQIPCV